MNSTYRRITIHDVAEAAGVSIKTVSRVIRNEPKASELTRNQVRDAIERLGYVPDITARRLSSKTVPVIGLLLAGLSGASIGRAGYEYRMALIAGANLACAEAGFGLSLVSLSESDQAPTYGELVGKVQRREIGALIITGPTFHRPGLMDALKKVGISVATLSAPEGFHNGPSVVSSDRKAMAALTRLVLEKGHRHIAFIRGNSGWRDTEERYAGFVQAMNETGITPNPAWVLQAEYNFDAGRNCAQQLLTDSLNRPTVIMASSDEIAAGVISVAHEKGIALPRDLSVTGYDDTGLARMLWPALTTVHQPVEQMTEQAVKLLVQRMQNSRSAKLASGELTLEANLVIRNSLNSPNSLP